MSWTSHENREPGVEHRKNAETMEREQITKHQHANSVKGDPTTPSRGSAYNTGGETQRQHKIILHEVQRLVGGANKSVTERQMGRTFR